MKKLLALCLAAVTCLSLSACNTDDNDRLLRKYKDKIETLEEQIRQQEETIADLTQQLQGKVDAPTEKDDPVPDPKPAPVVPDPVVPDAPPAPQYEDIEITLDNWQTYFEFVENNYFVDNAFGETYRLVIAPRFKLKDEYFPRLKEDRSSIILESQYRYGQRYCTVDYEAKTFTLGDWTSQTYPAQGSQIVDGMVCSRTMGMYYTESIRGGSGMIEKGNGGDHIMTYDNFEILRIQGTLCLEKV